MDAIKAGISQGLGKEASTNRDTAGVERDTFNQAKDLISKLDTVGKKNVLSAIDAELGNTVSSNSGDTSSASSMGNKNV